MQSPMERSFWSMQSPFVPVEFREVPADAGLRTEMLDRLSTLRRIPWNDMRSSLQDIGCRYPSGFGWTEIVETCGEELGVIEVLAFLQIAHDDGHRVCNRRRVTLELHGRNGPRRVVTAPDVRFLGTPGRRVSDRPWMSSTGGKP